VYTCGCVYMSVYVYLRVRALMCMCSIVYVLCMCSLCVSTYMLCMFVCMASMVSVCVCVSVCVSVVGGMCVCVCVCSHAVICDIMRCCVQLVPNVGLSHTFAPREHAARNNHSEVRIRHAQRVAVWRKAHFQQWLCTFAYCDPFHSSAAV
jgi:hypothetical protein